MEKLIAKYKLVCILIVLFSLPAVWALFVSGYYGASDDVHIGWLFEMDRVFQMGQIPPRFVPDLSYGFGYPLFNFVFPLPFYIGEIFHKLGLNLVDSIKTVFLLSIPLSGLAMYALLRKFSNQFLSFTGALIYIYTPYRSTDIYVRGAIGEILSFVFFPIIILSILNINLNKGKVGLRWVGIGGLSLGALVLTHDIAAFMFLPCVFLLALIGIVFTRQKISIVKIGLIFALGFLVSIYFWLPAILDSGLFKYDTVFNFVDHFPTLSQLLIPYWNYGASVAGPYDGMSFFIGLPNLILVIFAVATVLISWGKFDSDTKIFLSWGLIIFLISFFMMNFRSSIFWSTLPYLPYFQFPWRFLMMTTFITPIFIICLQKQKGSYFVALVLGLLSILLAIPTFRPQDFLDRKDDYFLSKYIPLPAPSAEYLKNQEEYLRLPKETLQRPDRNFPRVFGTDLGSMEVTEVNSLDANISLNVNSDVVINYNKYFFPGWTATLDSQKVQIRSGIPFGQISISVPKGIHSLNIQFRETLFHELLDILSIAGVCIAVIFVAKRGYNNNINE